MIIGQLAMQAIRRTVEEGAAKDASACIHDGTLHASGLWQMVMCVWPSAGIVADMAVHEHFDARLAEIEPALADAIRLLYIEAYAKALREHFEGIVDAMREAEAVGTTALPPESEGDPL